MLALVMVNLLRPAGLIQGLIGLDDMNRMAGLLISPFDVAGVAILISAGPRVASVLKPVAYGAMVAILIRAVVHGLIYGARALASAVWTPPVD